jgi:L-threonylcarbamoyladenylate synthase
MSYWKLKNAVDTLELGGVIAYPTEAVYGLGCDPEDEDAVLEILEIKQRPWEKGLILIAADFNQLQDYIEPVEADLLEQLEQSWPGPVTWVLPAREEVSPLLRGEHNTIAVRVTAHRQTAELCRLFGGPIVSTSANIAGQPPARTAHQVRWKVPGVDYVLSGSCSGSDKPTQIRDGLSGAILR